MLPWIALAVWVSICPAVARGQEPGATDAASARDEASLWFVRTSYQAWRAHPTTPGGQSHFQAFRVEIGRRVDGTRPWHQSYKYPSYGVGLFTADFGNAEQDRGRPLAVYGFLSLPLTNPVGRVQPMTDFGAGLALGWNAPEPEINPFEWTPTSSTTIYVDWGLYLKVLMTKRMDLIGGASLMHFSNGGLHAPNFGINLPGPRLALRYSLDRRRPISRPRPLPSFVAGWELQVSGGAGAKNIFVPTESPELRPADTRRSFGVGHATATVMWHFRRSSKLGGGADFSYDGSANARVDVTGGMAADSRGSFSNRLNLGLHGGYEQVIGRLSVLAHLGRYVWRDRSDGQVASLYQRLGVRYALRDNVFWGVNIRFFDRRTADYIEWHVGYRYR